MIEAALRRDRWLVAGGIIAVVLAAWAWLLAGAGMAMGEMDGMLMPMRMGPAGPGDAAVLLAMWAVMMAAMMLPSAAPMLLLYAAVARGQRQRGEAAAHAGLLGLGYVAIWSAFSLGAAALQLAGERLALISPMMTVSSVRLAGAVLLAAGLYQLTPWKQACLGRCASPLQFVLQRWRDGAGGAFRMGLRHGLDCLGCCWLLMLLLFVGGVMNLAWIAGLSLYVAVEKFVPRGSILSRLAGLALIAWGAATLIGS